jgi:bifunctional non-homologous end joining protein LigD
VFLDCNRNGRASSVVAAYSTRALPGAPVSVPLAWSELSTGIHSNHFRIDNVRERLAALDSDPWEGFASPRQSITRGMRADVGIR